MTLAVNILDLLDPQAIFVLLAVIFAAIKAFFEHRKKGESEEIVGEETEFDPYQAYEEELARQRRNLQIKDSSPTVPPPLDNFTPTPPLPSVPIRPRLSRAEEEALSNLNLLKTRRSRKAGNSTRSRLYRHLSSPTAAREALLLAEVLGPPKSLQNDR
ncbi:hypothetical protein N9C66_08560 [Akkermansiaceae bacterium]|nr:hypothetical protein [Akkermansiaceae bacterium]MDA8976570.1 hypothetical protein [bacterium]MDA7929628.1 hypothetical protein [Akkermansiaceae bacterium]MDA9831381.1 hypothetical protein [Akkermansiaceae bacterium]MDB4357896.1 hypothetical protein [bacterium]